jgi:GTP-binding protein EngB required for normal cell division
MIIENDADNQEAIEVMVEVVFDENKTKMRQQQKEHCFNSWFALKPGAVALFPSLSKKQSQSRSTSAQRDDIVRVLLRRPFDPSDVRAVELEPHGMHDVYSYRAWQAPYFETHRERIVKAKHEKVLLDLRAELTSLRNQVEYRRLAGRWVEKAPEQLRKEALRDMPDMDVGRFNVAMVGPSGMGKSSLVNALIAVHAAYESSKSSKNCKSPKSSNNNDDSDKPKSFNHARTSAGEECTDGIKRYDLPGTDISVWDLPGGGTARHPTDTFVTDKHVAAFDMQIIVMEGRFTDFHTMAVKAALQKFKDQHVVAVCAKADGLVLQEATDLQVTADEAFRSLACKIRARVVEQSEGRVKDVFLLSSWALRASSNTSSYPMNKKCSMHEEAFVAHLAATYRAWQDTVQLESKLSATTLRLDDAME